MKQYLVEAKTFADMAKVKAILGKMGIPVINVIGVAQAFVVDLTDDQVVTLQSNKLIAAVRPNQTHRV